MSMASQVESPQTCSSRLQSCVEDGSGETKRESNNVFNVVKHNNLDSCGKSGSDNRKKNTPEEQKNAKWYSPLLEDNNEETENLLCVVRQFCLEKPVTMAVSYTHVKLC